MRPLNNVTDKRRAEKRPTEASSVCLGLDEQCRTKPEQGTLRPERRASYWSSR